MSKKPPPTQIKGDPTQNLKITEAKVKNFERQLQIRKDELIKTPAMYHQTHIELDSTAKKFQNDFQNAIDRTNYNKRAIVSNRNDQRIFKYDLVQIHKDATQRKEKYETKLHQLYFEQQEMEKKWKSKIDAVVHQLRSLKEFQETRRIIVDQIRDLKALIFKERQIHSDELTDIHHQLLDQRDFYENDLRNRLSEAKKFAKDYADLHIDTLTQKIMNESVEKRGELNQINHEEIQSLYTGDKLLNERLFLKKRNKILHMNVDKATIDKLNLKSERKIIEKQMNNSIENNKELIFIFKEEKNEKIIELSKRILSEREKNEKLKSEASEALQAMKDVENSRIDQFSCIDEKDVINKVNIASKYVLSALESKYGATDDPVFLSQTTPMSKLIRRLTLLRSETTETKQLSLTLSTPQQTVKVSQEVQTDKPIRSKKLKNITTSNNENNSTLTAEKTEARQILTPRPMPPVTPPMSPASPRCACGRNRMSTPRRERRRKGHQYYEFSNTPEFKRLAKTGRLPSSFIHIIRSPQ